MTNVEWKKIPGNPDYRVSNDGRVLNIETSHTLKIGQDREGFPRVYLYKNGIKTTALVHRLVAEQFLEGFDPQKEVLFIDGNKQNCRAENLKVGPHGCRQPKTRSK